MKKVKVYRFEMFDIRTDMYQQSSRFGTLEAIKEITGARVLQDKFIDVDESAVQSDIPGLTARNFHPSSMISGSFQTNIPV
jgi:hypothetical protein